MRSTEIIIALITLVGVLGSALFANWDRVFNEEKNEATLVVSPSSTKFGGISSTTNEKYVTNNTYDKNNTNYQSVIKSEINIIKQSRNTKKYNGIWEGIPVKVYIKWENYTGSGGQVDGVVESLQGKVITTFTGKNYAFRKLKVLLSSNNTLYLKAKAEGLFKIWTASNIEFSRKYK